MSSRSNRCSRTDEAGIVDGDESQIKSVVTRSWNPASIIMTFMPDGSFGRQYTDLLQALLSGLMLNESDASTSARIVATNR